MEFKKRRLSWSNLVSAVLGILSCGAAAAPDVTSQIIDLGTFDAGSTYGGVQDVVSYRQKLYFPGTADNDKTFFLCYYDPVTGAFAREKGINGTDLIIDQESAHDGYVIDGELLISSDDGAPNANSGLWVRTSGGWKQKPTGYDATHEKGQYKYKGKYFASITDNSAFNPPSAGGSCTRISTDNLATWRDIGDPLGVFVSTDAEGNTTADKRNTYFYFELNGELFATGYKSVPNGIFSSIVNDKWMIHYTGDANDSFEVAHVKSSDFWSGLNPPVGFPPVRKAVTLRNGKGLVLASQKIIRCRFEPTQGANGIYSKPVGEAEPISQYALDLFTQNGVAYVVEGNSSTDVIKLHASTDGIQWTTLCQLTDPINGAFNNGSAKGAVLNGEIYLANGNRLFRVPKSVIGELPQNNAAPVVQGDTYSNGKDFCIRVTDPRQGVLGNDTDPDRDPLYASLRTSPANGTVILQPDGTFTYHANVGFSGTDSFTYFATDEKDTSIGTVMLQVEPVNSYTVDNSDASFVSYSGAWSFANGYTSLNSFFGVDFRTDSNAVKGAKTVRFTPPLQSSAPYEVYIYYPASSSSYANNVPVTVTHAGGTASVTLNQTTNGGRWNSLGTWFFNAGTAGAVTIGTTGTTKTVVADAVRFVSREAPSALSARAVSWAQVALQWTENTSDETGFVIDRRAAAEALWSEIATLPAGSTSFIDSGLSPETTYTYRVRAQLTGGLTEPSNEAVTTTRVLYQVAADADSYVANSNLTSNYGSGGELLVEQKGGPTYRKAFLRFNVAAFKALGSAANGAALRLFTSTWGGSSYTFQFYGLKETASGESAGGWTESGITYENAPANNLSANGFTSDATLLGSLTVPSGTVAKTLLNFTSATLDSFLTADTNGTVTLMVVRQTSSSNNTRFYSRETAVADVEGPVLVTSPALPPAPATPSGLTVVRTNTSSAAISWYAVAGASSYRLERSTDLVNWTALPTLGGDVAEYVDNSLSAGVIYYYRIQAINAGGSSAPSLAMGKTPENWRAGFFSTAELGDAAMESTMWGDLADADGDGSSNLLEYVAGTHPRVPDGQETMIVAGRSGGSLTLDYRRSRFHIGANIIVEWSADLQAWSSAGVSEVVVVQGVLEETVRATIPTDPSPRQFVRLRVVRE